MDKQIGLATATKQFHQYKAVVARQYWLPG